MLISRQFKHIVLYGLLLAAFVFLLKWLQWKYLINDHLIRPQTREIVKEVVVVKEVAVPAGNGLVPVFDKAVWEKLGFTTRENEVLQHLVKGLSNAEIAANLYLSVSTVKTHVSNLLFKLDVNSRVKAIEKTKQMANFKEMYRNPLFAILVSYMEVLPLGLVVAAVSALLLKRKSPSTE